MKNTLFLLLVYCFFSCKNGEQKPVIMEQTPSINLEEISIEQLQKSYQLGEISVQEVVQFYLDRIEKIDKNGPTLHSIIELNPDALAIAATMDEEIKAGKSRGKLHGIPVLIKDNIDTFDKMHTTAGSCALLGSKPLKDSWVANRLRASGAIILGKTNLSEWANFRGNHSSSGWSGVGGQAKNPYVLDATPCGSSSGSGVAVSANLCMVAVGTETNGSIVCPAHSNGIVGIKPTVGLWSRAGIVPISFTQDTPGPMTRTVRDAAIFLGALAGVDEADSKTLASAGKTHSDYTKFLKKEGLKGKKVGLFMPYAGKHTGVDSLMRQAVDFLKNEGVTIIELDKIFPNPIYDASYEVMLYEFKDGVNQYLASLGENALIKSLSDLIEFNKQDSIELRHFGQELLMAAAEKGDLSEKNYLDALERMRKTVQDEGIDRVMDAHQLDAIIAPTGRTAWKVDHANGDQFSEGSSSPAAMSGYPNITVPMGFVGDLPVGISFFGRAWSEPILLEIAYGFEQGTKARRVPRFLEE